MNPFGGHIIGIVGTRRRNTEADFDAVLNAWRRVHQPEDWICSGGCPKGGDRFAKRIADLYRIPYLEFPADWERHGRGAGFVRSKYIAESSDILIACVADDRTGGTEHTIRLWREVHPDQEPFILLPQPPA